MRIDRRYVLVLAATLVVVAPRGLWAADPEVEELKRQVRILQKRIDQLEKERAAPPAAAAPAPAPPGGVAAPAEIVGHAAPVEDRGALRDEQQAAPRPEDLTLDPKYHGFAHIPNTDVLIKFNAKPRTDFTFDPQNTGDDNRFVTAKIPVHGDPEQGGGTVTNINAKGSQLRVDVRAPTLPGSPRFYYENDFYGSGSGEFPYRIRHIYGQIYGIIVGQTFSVFEDPDVWPDTVDYEGPNSAVFARRPLVRYQRKIGDEWQLNLGLEQPESEIDTSIDTAAHGVNHAPDGGFNVRWENADIGHVQFATILRDIAVRGPTVGQQSTFGWGLNLSGVFNTVGRDSLQAQLTYGEGIFRYVNDDFVNNDAAFDHHGDIEAIPYFGGMFGYTHHWADDWRSTVSYGYAHLDNTASQAGTAYHQTDYASANVIWQLRRRLAVGVEGLYGHKQTKDGTDGEVWRATVGVMASIFD